MPDNLCVPRRKKCLLTQGGMSEYKRFRDIGIQGLGVREEHFHFLHYPMHLVFIREDKKQ
jgi:hypothetical protein